MVAIRNRALKQENHTGIDMGDLAPNCPSPIEDKLIEAVFDCVKGTYLRPMRDFLTRHGRKVFPAQDVEQYQADEGRCWFIVHWCGATFKRCMPIYEHCANKLLNVGIEPPAGNEFLGY